MQGLLRTMRGAKHKFPGECLEGKLTLINARDGFSMLPARFEVRGLRYRKVEISSETQGSSSNKVLPKHVVRGIMLLNVKGWIFEVCGTVLTCKG